jgi:hypothetical protein
MRHYQTLTLKEKIALLDMVKTDAVYGPQKVHDLLTVVEVYVRESDIRTACLGAGFTEYDFHLLWKLSENAPLVVFGL